MTTLNLRAVRLRSGEQFRDRIAVRLDPLELGGQRYVPAPEEPEALFTLSRVSSGHVFRLEFEIALHGPCVRCLEGAHLDIPVDATEYQAGVPGESDELTTPYLSLDRLDLSSWANDAIALALPEKILCRTECAGLCGSCGVNLNEQTCRCSQSEPDGRWNKLAELLARSRPE